MFIFIILALATALALVRGGKFTNLARVQFHWSALILFGFLIQVVIYSGFWQNNPALKPLSPYAYMLSLLLLLGALARNQHLPGMRLLSLGFALNALAIFANGGYMPATPEARAFAGQPILAPGEIRNNSIGAGADTRLLFLTDLMAIPRALPLPNVFSIGDVLIAIGAAYLLQKAMTPAPLAPR